MTILLPLPLKYMCELLKKKVHFKMSVSLTPTAYPDGGTLTESLTGRGRGPSTTCHIRTARQAMRYIQDRDGPRAAELVEEACSVCPLCAFLRHPKRIPGIAFPMSRAYFSIHIHRCRVTGHSQTQREARTTAPSAKTLKLF